jgi:dipeptidyl aminopeptidase/acylaminoacyl peptidase
VAYSVSTTNVDKDEDASDLFMVNWDGSTRIKTPTMFMCGEKDFNVPLIHSEQMYQALRSLNVPTKLIIYPGQYHGLSKPSYKQDRLERMIDWYGQYLKAESE